MMCWRCKRRISSDPIKVVMKLGGRMRVLWLHLACWCDWIEKTDGKVLDV